MYLHLEHKTIPPELQSDAVGRLARLHRLMSQSPGFLDAQICADVNTSASYMVVRAWESAAAHAGYRTSDEAKAFAANRPPQPLWENTAVQEWVSVSAHPDNTRSTYVIRAHAEPPQSEWAQMIGSAVDEHGARSIEPGQSGTILYIPLGSTVESLPDVMMIRRTEDAPAPGRVEPPISPDSLVFGEHTHYRVIDDVRHGH